MTETTFSYEEAFRRNIGWLTHVEQQFLRKKRVAIAGLGGVGGSYVTTFARLGIGAFTIADSDVFELANFNRQVGAKISTIGKAKINVLAAMAHDINPEIDLRLFNQGVTEQDIDAFLADANIYVDALDFFAIDIRRKIFARCYERGIPAITAAPIGMGTAFLLFVPGGMTFEEWFRFDAKRPALHPVNFAMGLAPAGLHRSYLMDLSAINFDKHNVPSTGLACDLCAGVTAAQLVKILLGRGDLEPVPTYHHFDAYRCLWKKGVLAKGNGGLLQRFKMAVAYRQFEKMAEEAYSESAPVTREIERILDIARWSPSGDNMQPWRFQIIDDDHLYVFLHGPEDFYETILQSKGILLSAGGFVAAVRLAAASFGRSLDWTIAKDGEGHRLHLSLLKDATQKKDPLASFIRARSVNRFPYKKKPLTNEQKRKLEESVGPLFEIVWHETRQERLRASLINMAASAIRLRVPEAFPTHCHILDWEKDFSADRVPAKAICIDPIARCIMKFMMKSWSYVTFANRFAGGTVLPQLEMDLLPGLCCAAHFVIRFRKEEPETTTPEALIRAGEAMHRFWLVAASEDLVLQPSFAALVYGLYATHPAGHAPFVKPAMKLAERVKRHAGAELSHIAFLGRIGTPRDRRVTSRSVRKPLENLIKE